VALSPGTRLGPYEVLSALGAGGMGEVYRARDTKLNRDVALKVLPDAFAADAERLARFKREAQVLASLNHPHIAAIYGFEDSGSTHALVLELVEGPTLADRIAQGPIPIDDALPLAMQIAEALEAAHEQGIVHRDLKPANITLRPDGTVKVLDFGLAKALEPAGLAPDSSHVATVESPAMTKAGFILGTAAYMSPEQARGKPVDKRADIWAFGCVLYEMLTGRRLIQGETISDTLAALLKDKPDWARVPDRARTLLARCLEKDPKRRLRDIGDAWSLLEESKRPGPAPIDARWPIVAASFALIAAVGLWGWWRAAHPAASAPRTVLRLDVDLGANVSLGSEPGAGVIISPAGDRLVYVSQSRLFSRSLDQERAVELPGTEGAVAPFFSPDGEWVAFFAQDQLKKISVHGGTPIAVCYAGPNSRGGTWGGDDYIVAALGANGVGLSRVSANGGSPAPLTELDHERSEVTHRWPQVLPGSRALLFTAHTAVNGFDDASIEAWSFADRRRKTLLRGGTYGRYVGEAGGDGYLLYLSKGTLFAERFNVDRLETIGSPIPAIEHVAYAAGFGSAEFDVSRTGRLVYRGGEHAGPGLVTVQYLDRAGKTEPFLAKAGDYLYPSLSPDGNRIVLGSGGDIAVYDRRRDTTERLTSGGEFQMPLWSPDGRYIVFKGPGGIVWTRVDGASAPRPLIKSAVALYPWAFTADGARLSVQELDVAKGRNYSVWTVAVARDSAGLSAGAPERFLISQARQGHPAISPDGRWVAYFTDASGTRQVFVRAFPDRGSQWRVSNTGGMYPTWSRTGRELLYRTEDNRVMVVRYAVMGDSFIAEKPQPWTEARLANVGQWRNFDTAPDGRIVALMSAGQKEADHHAVFVANFLDQLRRITAR
jgi:Protein kinase domain/WD40-like Beta Propeller Repeat